MCTLISLQRRINENRFFLYHEIAKVLGVNGVDKRAKLPWCVNRRIRKLYPDPEGTVRPMPP